MRPAAAARCWHALRADGSPREVARRIAMTLAGLAIVWLSAAAFLAMGPST